MGGLDPGGGIGPHGIGRARVIVSLNIDRILRGYRESARPGWLRRYIPKRTVHQFQNVPGAGHPIRAGGGETARHTNVLVASGGVDAEPVPEICFSEVV